MSAWATSETRDRLDAAGRGIYRELLDQCYAQGKIPDDQEWACRRCACTLEQYEKAWIVIARHFPKIDGSEYRRNLFADMMRDEFFSYIQRQRKSGKSRADKAKQFKEMRSTGSAVAQRVLKNSAANTIQYNTTQVVKPFVGADAPGSPTSAPASPDFPIPMKLPVAPSFADWWAVWWNKTAKVAAQKAWPSVAAQYGAQFLVGQVAADRARFESTPQWEWRANLHPATWLRGHRWEDQLPPAVAPRPTRQAHIATQRAAVPAPTQAEDIEALEWSAEHDPEPEMREEAKRILQDFRESRKTA